MELEYRKLLAGGVGDFIFLNIQRRFHRQRLHGDFGRLAWSLGVCLDFFLSETMGVVGFLL
jgi:hypothetical protein